MISQMLLSSKRLHKQLFMCQPPYGYNKIDSEGDTVIQVLVPNDRMSTVIGKAGNIANSIRTIVQAAAYNKKLGRVRINIDSL